jgi:hypothetical protein
MKSLPFETLCFKKIMLYNTGMITKKSPKTKSTKRPGNNLENYLVFHDAVDNFMLAEYRRLTEMLLYTKEMGHKRVQFWITILTGVSALVAVIYQINGDDSGFISVALGALFGMYVIGFIFFIKMVQRTINSVEYIRAQGKIKRYFFDKNPIVSTYLFFPIADDKPPLKHSFAFSLTGSGMRMLVVIINSFLLAGLVFLLPRVIYGDWSMLVFQLIMGISVFVISFAVHEAFTASRFRRAEAAVADKVEFPSQD